MGTVKRGAAPFVLRTMGYGAAIARLLYGIVLLLTLALCPFARKRVYHPGGEDYPNPPTMMITEHATAYDDPVRPDGVIDDQRRVRYLRSHIDAAAAAIAEGVDLRGYLVWSLLDDFEWSEGYTQRFGIVHLDHATQARTPRRSAAWYRRLIQRNGEPE